jgi:hypothetical protein
LACIPHGLTQEEEVAENLYIFLQGWVEEGRDGWREGWMEGEREGQPRGLPQALCRD